MPDGTAIYHRRQPEKTVFYQIIQQYFSQWQSDYPYRHQETLPYYIEDEFKRFIKCGILSEGFARVRCAECSHDYIVAFSCKRRAACPSCCAKYREYTVQHLLDEVLPKVPMRQIVLSLPKWIRFYVARDSALSSKVLKIFISEVEKQFQKNIPDLPSKSKLGAITFVTEKDAINKILTHLGEETETPVMQTARAPPDDIHFDDDFNEHLAIDNTLHQEFDQRISW